MIKLFKTNWLYLAGIALGSIGGYAYYYFVGCANGTCAITSSPINSTLYGALMGALMLSGFKKEGKINKDSKYE